MLASGFSYWTMRSLSLLFLLCLCSVTCRQTTDSVLAESWKTQVTTLPDGRTRYRFKQLYERQQEEPSGSDVEGLEANDYPSGALCLVPHNSDVTIHKVDVQPLADDLEE